jgi:hypothetical protein
MHLFINPQQTHRVGVSEHYMYFTEEEVEVPSGQVREASTHGEILHTGKSFSKEYYLHTSTCP